MSYHVQLTDTAKKQLKKMDRQTASMLLGGCVETLKDARTHDNTAKALAQTEAGNGVTALGIIG